jgi:tetratricopeptide (TPR) repeat protein
VNGPFLKQALRDNKYLLIALVVIVISIPLFALRSGPDAQAELRPSDSAAGSAATELDSLEFPVSPARTTVEARARQTISEYQQRFAADPSSEEAPALLGAMGNLYRQKLSDYEQAAGCFEQLINEYPDDPGVRDAHLQLLICYERLGDQENRSRVLRRLMNVYPPGSSEHDYAAEQLGIVQ